MKKFIVKLLNKLGILLLFIVVLIGGAVLLNFDHKVDYPAAIIGKYKRMDALRDKNKILICGGSSSSYGINSAALGNAFGLPVVNTSLAMSLGSRFHLNLTKDYLKKGDVIVYIPEYEFYYGNEKGDDFLYTTAFYYPFIITSFSEAQQRNVMKESVRLSLEFFSGYVKRSFSEDKQENLQYRRESYNDMGDNISLVKVQNSKITPQIKNRYQKLKSSIISSEFIDFLSTFNKECKNKGVKLVVTFPPLEKSQFDNRFLDDINTIKKNTDIEFVGNPEDYLYDSELFYDSSYHLNGRGRKIRSQKLINELKTRLN